MSSNDFFFLLVQFLKVFRTEWLISGVLLLSLDRFRVLADSFRDKPSELHRNNSRPEKDILNYAMYHNGSAQARGFKTASIPNESDFYSEDFPLDTPRS